MEQTLSYKSSETTENYFSKRTIECDIIHHDQDRDHLLNAEPGRQFSLVLLPHGCSFKVPSSLFADGERILSWPDLWEISKKLTFLYIFQ